MADSEEPISVALVMPCRDVNDITVPTMTSVIGTINLLNSHGIRFETNIHTGGAPITATRNWTVKKFLEGACTRFFALDSDLTWRPQDFLRLLALSAKYPVIGACYTAKRDPPFFLMHADPGFKRDEHGCIPVSGMGLGFTCLQRSVLETLSATAPSVRHRHSPDPFPEVFRFDKIGDEFRGEDFALFADIRALGIPVMLDPGIVIGHIGSKEFSGKLADHFEAAAIAAE